MARSVWVIHGPNLNLLGIREPELYGREGLAAMDKRIAKLGETLGLQVQSFQSNHEGALLDLLTVSMEEADGCLLNPAALSHTSMALADTLRAMTIPVVEVHLTNLYAREIGRHDSLTAAASSGSPSWNFTFGRIFTVSVRMSLENCQDSARSPTTLVPVLSVGSVRNSVL
jgi:3-dehydroquinate dehydratase-2